MYIYNIMDILRAHVYLHVLKLRALVMRKEAEQQKQQTNEVAKAIIYNHQCERVFILACNNIL